jgi:hypothetical protein
MRTEINFRDFGPLFFRLWAHPGFRGLSLRTYGLLVALRSGPIRDASRDEFILVLVIHRNYPEKAASSLYFSGS